MISTDRAVSQHLGTVYSWQTTFTDFYVGLKPFKTIPLQSVESPNEKSLSFELLVCFFYPFRFIEFALLLLIPMI